MADALESVSHDILAALHEREAAAVAAAASQKAALEAAHSEREELLERSEALEDELAGVECSGVGLVLEGSLCC
jgi:hypothetical protein